MVRKVNKSLKDWVSFIKRVQKEEGLSYKDAMQRAKVRKNKGEKWQSGGKDATESVVAEKPVAENVVAEKPVAENVVVNNAAVGGKRRSKTAKKQKRGRRKTNRKK